MKKTLVSFLSVILGFITVLNAEKALGGGTSTTSTITYNLDACDAFVIAGTIGDYSEFEGISDNNSTCSQLEAITTIYRDNPTVNTHSCTQGVNSSPGMCVSSMDDCTYDPGNTQSIKFDVLVSPGPSGTGNISNLSFYELAPQNYSWIAGPGGLNDYPTKYGVRVLKNGVEVFRSAELATTQDWTLETFDFSSNSEFTVDVASIFSFELLAYCSVGNNAGISVWDIDEVSVTSSCQSGQLSGGSLTTSNGETNLSICANDGISDAFDIILSGETGSESAWIITDPTGNIIGLPVGPPFDLEGAGTGICYVWHVTYDGTISDLVEGININAIVGCYALSNPIIVNRNISAGATIISTTGQTEITICAGDGIADPIDVNITGNNSPFNSWVITDLSGNILGLPAGPPFDLEGAGIGVCQIWNLGYDGTLSGLIMDNNISDIVGCFGLSNAITVTRVFASAGTISSGGQTEFNICAGDGVADLIDVQLTGNIGAFGAWLLTDVNGRIIDLLPGSPFNLDGAVSGTCYISHLSYDGSITGLARGNNISDLSGCFGISNSITINKTRTSGGVLSYDNRTFFQLCGGDPLISNFDPILNGNSGANLEWLITDDLGNVIEFSSPPFDFSGLGSGRFRIYGLTYDGTEPGIVVGENVEILTNDCAGLSNPIVLAIEMAEGGTITSATGDVIDLCIQGPSSMNIDISLSGNVGSFSRWILTDLNGNIVALPSAPPFSISFLGLPTCLVYHLSYEPSFSGLILGNNISVFSGCYDLSNAITLNKQAAVGGSLSTNGQITTVDICGANANSQLIDVVLNNNEGENQVWVITDVDGNILDLPVGPPFDFSSYGNGNYRLWNLSYNGNLQGAEIGLNANDLAGDCFGLSNFIAVNKSTVGGGSISSSFGNNFTICAGDGSPDIIDIELTGEFGNNSRWIITDAAGNITGFPSSPPFDLDSNTGSTCLIWHISFDNLSGLNLGANTANFQGCYSLSNPITVNKTSVNGGVISSSHGDNITACVDGINDNIDAVVTGSTGTNNQWVITDTAGNILGLPLAPPFDFDPAGVGTCLIWNVSFENIDGLAMGNNVSAITGCYAFSNFLTVTREVKDAGEISFFDGSTEITICAGDGAPDPLDISVFGGDVSGNVGWLITDTDLNILGMPAMLPIDLENAGAGICLIWRISYSSGLTGLDVGANAEDILGCYDVSNFLTVNRVTFEGASVASSTVLFDLNDCDSDTATGTNEDYSEFTGTVNNDSECTTFEVVENLHRTNPSANAHSCTPGVNGSIAMCVSSLPFCDFMDDNERAIRFSVNVTPPASGQGGLSSISFYEKAPLTFEWINGATGINNYPTRYGIRVLKDGVEIFKQDDIITTTDWTLETFDFSSNPDFFVESTTRFDFELLGYCRIDNTGSVSAWDVDEILIGSICNTGLNSGILTTTDGLTEVEICADDGTSDAFNTMVIGAAGDNAAWVITDDTGLILDLPLGPPFDLEGAGAGVCYLWYLTYADGLVGLEVGLEGDDLQGCFELSNPIIVTRLTGTDCITNTIVDEEEDDVEILEPEVVQSFDVIPNPVVSVLTIKTDNLPIDGTKMIVYDRMGQVVGNSKLNEQSTEIALDNYPSGIYYVKVISGKHISTQSFIKL